MAASVALPARWISAITARVVALALAVCSDLAARACAAVSTLPAVPSFRPPRLAAARAARDNREAREGRSERGRDDPPRRMFCASAIPAGSRLIGWAPAKRERNATCFVPVLLHAGRQVDLSVLQRPLETGDAGRVALAESDDDADALGPAERRRDALTEGERPARRHAIREWMVERNVEGNVGEVHRVLRLSYSRRASLRSSQAMRLYS